MPKRTANAVWNGSLEEGNGTMRMRSGAYEGPYTFQSRFKEGEGTNPEELIAAAHAGCFSMALSGDLGRAGYEPETVETTATVHLEMGDGPPTVARIVLDTQARVPGSKPASSRSWPREPSRTARSRGPSPRCPRSK
jgi:lipoyl-dependent peroxiredoxin